MTPSVRSLNNTNKICLRKQEHLIVPLRNPLTSHSLTTQQAPLDDLVLIGKSAKSLNNNMMQSHHMEPRIADLANWQFFDSFSI